MPGVADLARPARHGGYRATGLQNLLLNLYSLVKERLISQAPPNAGESAVRRTCRRTRSSSTRCFDHRAAGDLNCFREPGLAGRDDRNSADQTWATSFQLSIACVVSDVVISDEVGEYIPVGATVKGW